MMVHAQHTQLYHEFWLTKSKQALSPAKHLPHLRCIKNAFFPTPTAPAVFNSLCNNVNMFVLHGRNADGARSQAAI